MNDLDSISQDILMIVGGAFNPAAVGPEKYEATLARIRSQQAAYLDAFEAMFLGTKFDPQTQSSLYLAAFLNYLKDVDPERVRAITENLLKQYDAILIVFDQVAEKSMLDQLLPSGSTDFLLRLNDRREALRRLLQSS